MMLDKENISKTDLISQYQLRLAERYFPEYLFRSSPPEVFWKKGFLEISQNSQKGFLIFSGGIESERPATLLKKRLRHKCFPVNFVKFLTPFLTEHLWWLRLEWIIEDSDLTNTIGFLMISGRGGQKLTNLLKEAKFGDDLLVPTTPSAHIMVKHTLKTLLLKSQKHNSKWEKM